MSRLATEFLSADYQTKKYSQPNVSSRPRAWLQIASEYWTEVNLLRSSVHFGHEPNRKRVCGSLNRTRQNHYGSKPNQTEPGTVKITPLMSSLVRVLLIQHSNDTVFVCQMSFLFGKSSLWARERKLYETSIRSVNSWCRTWWLPEWLVQIVCHQHCHSDFCCPTVFNKN